MPLTFTVTEGVLNEGSEGATFKRLCEAMLKWHGLSGNRVMTPNVVGTIHVRRKEETFSGLEQNPIALIEWKVPSFAFTDRGVQQGYIEEATQIVHTASAGRLPKENIWCTIVHGVEGAWGIAGQAFTNAELAESVARG